MIKNLIEKNFYKCSLLPWYESEESVWLAPREMTRITLRVIIWVRAVAVVTRARVRRQLMLWSEPLQWRTASDLAPGTMQSSGRILAAATGHDTTAPPSSILSHHPHPLLDNSARLCVSKKKTVAASSRVWASCRQMGIRKVCVEGLLLLQLIQLLYKNTKNWFSCYCEVIKFCSIFAVSIHSVDIDIHCVYLSTVYHPLCRYPLCTGWPVCHDMKQGAVNQVFWGLSWCFRLVW